MSLARAILGKKESRVEETVYSACGTELDPVELAQEAVKAGIIDRDVLDQLTSLHPQVPDSMKRRYFLIQILNTVSKDEELLMRMVHVFLKFRSYPINTSSSAAKAAATNSREDFPLSTRDIPYIAEILVPYASHWRSIGTALRFKPQDLDNILECPYMLSDASKSFLLKLLEEWLENKHKHTLRPTLSVLENALNSRLVGLGALACEVRELLSPRLNSSEESKVLPYYIASVHIRRCGISRGPPYYNCL